MRKLATLLTLGALCLSILPWHSDAQLLPKCKTFLVPLVTHENMGTPSGPQHLLDQKMKFTLDVATTTDPNAGVFGVSGTSLMGIPTTTTGGLFAMTPGEEATAYACPDKLWDFNIVIQRWEFTAGDMVTVFAEDGGGAKTTLAMFTVGVDAGGQRGVFLTGMFPGAAININDRGLGGPYLAVGDFIPFSKPTLAKALKTPVITSNVPMEVMNSCQRLGLTIKRAGQTGKTMVAFTDVVVVRDPAGGTDSGNRISNTGAMVTLHPDDPGIFPTGTFCGSPSGCVATGCR